jgi:hypothetical protein
MMMMGSVAASRTRTDRMQFHEWNGDALGKVSNLNATALRHIERLCW